MSKKQLITDIARLSDIPDPGLGVGSSVPKSLFDGVCERFNLGSGGSMPRQAERIVEGAGMHYVTGASDSTGTPSGGGSTVTEQGLQQIKMAVQRLIALEG